MSAAEAMALVDAIASAREKEHAAIKAVITQCAILRVQPTMKLVAGVEDASAMLMQLAMRIPRAELERYVGALHRINLITAVLVGLQAGASAVSVIEQFNRDAEENDRVMRERINQAVTTGD